MPGPLQEYLTTRSVVRTTSLEEARAAVEKVYLPHHLEGRRETLDMRLNATSDRTLTLGYLTYGADTALTMPPTETCYHVNLDIVGETWADCSGRRGRVLAHTRPRTGGTVLTPDRHTTVRWAPDAEQLILKISRVGLESHLASLIGRPVGDVVDFDLGLDLAGAAGQSLLRSVEFLAAELDRPDGVATSPLARGQLESYVLTQLLLAGHHQYSDALAGRDDRSRLGRLAPVLAYIEENADTELTPELLAKVACVSVRTLHAAFADQLGVSPMAHVRGVRLGKVRAELLEGDPERVRVTDVATRWGFFHSSRFAQQYREQFGELPSTTLNR